MNGRHRRTRTATRRPVAVVASTSLLTTVGFAVVAVAGPSPVQAADPCYEPAVREIMVSQGLPSYDKLVRGKTTLYKPFVSEKPTKGCRVLDTASISITGASVTISNGTQATTLSIPAGTALPVLPPHVNAPAANLPSDPVLVLDGSKLVPPASGTTLTLTGSLTYRATLDATGAVLQEGTIPVAAVTKPLAPVTRPLRLLVVPMGDTDAASPEQFDASAQSTLQNALVAANRVLPVADGIGDITSTTGGLRYRVTAGMIDVGPHTEVVNGSTVNRDYMPGGLFCGGSASFPYLRQKLSDFRTAWNAENPATPADRVLGVVSQTVSQGPTTQPGNTCAEGYASVGGPESWVRVVEPAAGSPSGATTALELNHTYGGVADAAGFHSTNADADGTALGRGYNLTTRRQLSPARSAMRFDVSGWDNYSTLYEKRDWDFTVCMLASTASPSTECGSTTSGGTAPAQGAFVLSGSTDFTAAGTTAHTYFEPDAPVDGLQPSSDLRLAEIGATNAVIRHQGVRATRTNSTHTHPDGTSQAHDDGVALFDVALPAGAVAAYELWKGTPRAAGSTLLYRAVRDLAPEIGDVVKRVGPSTARRYTTDGVSSRPSVADDLVARTRDGQVVLSSLASPAPLATVAGTAGALSEDGTRLVVTSGGDVVVYPVTRPAGGVALGAATTVYDTGGLLAPGAASDAVAVDGSVVFTAAGDLYAVSTTSPLLPASSTLCGIGAALPLPLPGNPCTRVTATADASETGSSWSSTRGVLAYTSTTASGTPSVWTVDPAAPATATLRIPGVSEPAWAGELLLVSGASGLLAYDAATFATPSTITHAPGDTSVAASGATVLFSRPAGAANDVWQLRLDRTTTIVEVADNDPAAFFIGPDGGFILMINIQPQFSYML